MFTKAKTKANTLPEEELFSSLFAYSRDFKVMCFTISTKMPASKVYSNKKKKKNKNKKILLL